MCFLHLVDHEYTMTILIFSVFETQTVYLLELFMLKYFEMTENLVKVNDVLFELRRIVNVFGICYLSHCTSF